MSEFWIVGKGPNVDSYDWTKCTGPVMAINEAALVVPKCDYVIAVDYPVWDVLEEKLDRKIMVLMEEGIKKHYTFTNVFRWSSRKHSLPKFETGPSAVMVAKHFGCTKAHFVGFDSMSYTKSQHMQKGKPYAKSVLAVEKGQRNYFDYERINKHVWEALLLTGIEPVWEHTQQVLVSPFKKGA